MRLQIAAVLVHRFTDLRNRTQITALRNALEVREETRLDADGNPILGDDGLPIIDHWWAFSALPEDHAVRVYQVVPEGTARPANMGSLDSYNVIYGPDQPSHERRFLNWALKRATDHGADWVLYIRDISQFTPALPVRDFRRPAWGVELSKRVQARLGSGRREVVREALVDWAEALADFRDRVAAEGLDVD